MITSSAILLFRLVTLMVGLGAIGYKYVDYQRFRRTRLSLPMRLFWFYSVEMQLATTSRRKRNFMERGNMVTTVMLTCLLPNLVLSVYQLVTMVRDMIAAA